ncbi:anti-sigma factor RsiW [Silvibacterium bohemicum]|uniref:Anti-sigma factor RsiW n=1 Tax=Silvibacterium bohemicum TaxID=1577686 RepID=A0A841JYG0_9BACT|nr:anti-sigma factor [Silvibacterium bohemicum]MBB6146493.1 anti-sigma factor RsiW [Silvibacterium bohemicum]
MHCDARPANLGAYLDGELSLEQIAVVQKHLEDCPRCATEIAELVRLKQSLRPARGRFTPTAEFRRKVQSQVAVRKPRRWSLRLIPAIAAIAAMLFVAIAWIAYSRRTDDLAEIVDLHINALASTNLVDVVSTDRHTVKPWFTGKIPFTFDLPEFAGTGYTLLGGRLVYFHQRPGAQLIVALRQHKISVLIFQDSPDMTQAFAGPARVSRRNYFGIESWQSQELRFVVISDADPAAIETLSQSFQRANQ